MCVYHYEDSKRAEKWISILLLACILFSIGCSAPMFILTYPGDECLLFVSVRGEALIYGNPAGCNFISYGHAILTAIAIVVISLIFCRQKKGILRRKQPKEIGSNKSLRGTVASLNNGIGLGQSHYNIQSEDTVSVFGVSRFYSTKAIVLAVFAAIFSVISALVILSGYLTTCNELHYETRRQVLGRTTLGSPIRDLSIQCWSLFRDVDFHTRFHFDHYEFSGQWHGQYRGYKHGRVHDFESKHEHLIDVALALELSLSSTWFCAVFWVTITVLMILLKRRTKFLQKRELAESMEDAKIFASSRQLDPSQNMLMKPLDQLSVVSNQSSMLSQKPSMLTMSTNPMGAYVQSPQSNGSVPVVVQQQIMSQQELLNQQMQQMQLMQQRLHQSQPVLTQQQMTQQQPFQRPMSQPMAQQPVHYSQLQNGIVFSQAPPPQQNGVQYVQLTNGMLMPVQQPAAAQHQNYPPQQLAQTNVVGSLPQTSIASTKHHYSSIEESRMQKSLDTTDHSSQSAQQKQMSLSKDAGLKCSRI